ncbi:MAG: type II toxin-antitoxin system VapC family toxin [Pseudomonadota bacterium]
MIYVDTSALVALLTVEPASPKVLQWYAQELQPLASADWCIPEFASALAAKQRAGQLRAAQLRKAQQAFEALTAGGLRLLTVSREAHHQAASLCLQPQGRLRAGDALHLAVAREAGISRLAGLDSVMNASALQLGMTLVFMT